MNHKFNDKNYKIVLKGWLIRKLCFQDNKLAAKKMKQLADQIKKEKDAERKRFEGKLFG